MTGYRAAIDFGTSYTAAASQSGPQSAPVVVPLVDEGRLSSAVAIDDSGAVQAGPLVEQVEALAPDRVERTPKRCLDQPDVMLGREPVQTVALVAAVLGYVREELHRHFNGSDPDELCLTHPARWEAGDPRMRRLEAAAGQAGFGSVRLLPEPCAAALALAAEGKLDGVGAGELIAVYDLGGGTFDTALLSRAPGGDFVLVGEPGGDPELGGEWLDDRLFERLSGQLPAEDETSMRDPDSSPDPLRWRRAGFAFRQGIRRAKERLARETSVQIALNPPFSLDYLSLSRAELERTATPLITRSADCFDLFLQRNSKVPADLAAICLVGGSSRLTVVNRILGNRFNRPVANHGDPKSVTALGALSGVQAGAPAANITGSARRPKVSVGAETGSPGSPGRDQGSLSDVLDVPAAGRPSPSPHPGPGQPRGPGHGPQSPGSEPPAGTQRDGATGAGTAADEAELDALYTDGLAALYTEQWEKAVEAFRAVIARDRNYQNSEAKLEQALRGQRLAALYAAGCGAIDAGDWREAVEHLSAIVTAAPEYRDAQALLNRAAHERDIAELRAEAAALSHAQQWEAVVAVGERLQQLAPDAADPDGLISSARVNFDAAERGQTLAAHYQQAMRHMEAGQWQQALSALTTIQETEPDYKEANLLATRVRRELDESRQRGDHTSSINPDLKKISRNPGLLKQIKPPKKVHAVVFSPDSARLAFACSGWMAVVVDLTGKEQLRVRHDVQRSQVCDVAFDPGGRRLATAGTRGGAYIWDATTGEKLQRVCPSARVLSVAFSPDGHRLATSQETPAIAGVMGAVQSGESRSCVRIWDATDGKQLLEVAHPGHMGGVAFSPDGHCFAAAAGQSVRTWDAATGEQLLQLAHPFGAERVAFSPDGRLLATAGGNRAALVWDVATGERRLQLPHPFGAERVAFSPDGRLLATAGSEGATALIWDAATGKQLLEVPDARNRGRTIMGYQETAHDVAFSPNGAFLAISVNHERVDLWQLTENE